MDITKYSAFFLLSTVKFLFTPFGGPAAGLTFFETYLTCVLGAFVSGTIFYFLGEFLLKRSKQKNLLLRESAKLKGEVFKEKKKFTKMNKGIVKMKHRFGIVGISFFAPLFMSVPVGTIITAKFFGKRKITYPLILLGFCVNGLITTGIAYSISYFL
ncbi:MAG: hypothetical protein KA264_01475 [Crocinitomicaceae bacterium]|nr:hypothetical protein [Crocinitomicaceae bacterium]